MKKILFTLCLFALVACGGKKQQDNAAQENTQAADTSAAISEDTSATASDATASNGEASGIDGVTSATSKPNEIIFNGSITATPQKHATVSMTMGGQIKSTSLLPGQFIARGAVVATVANPEFISLQQSYLDSHAQAEFLKTEFERQTTLAQNEAASKKKLQQSKAEYLSMESKVQSDAAQLRLLGFSPAALLQKGIQQLLIVRAPISGYVGNVYMNVGKYMQAGESLCEIMDKTAPMLCLTSYEKDVTALKVGEDIAFRVNGFGKKVFYATIVSVGQNIDQVNHSTQVYAKIIGNNPQFRPGMYVSARLEK
ncbi:MAG: efflux RND transporter periplasmic adaptor subunit [Bacteroidales bacterium]|jgi:membrane fusion protein, heavy metal efflux system|nr:efflux RND transporter periplasmic adaptor subunit [Bacteroidales bacterium]MCI1733158.1 efflux RND transporter periplasmic adaptor subunit [Bacteroidales bacterium]